MNGINGRRGKRMARVLILKGGKEGDWYLGSGKCPFFFAIQFLRA